MKMSLDLEIYQIGFGVDAFNMRFMMIRLDIALLPRPKSYYVKKINFGKSGGLSPHWPPVPTGLKKH